MNLEKEIKKTLKKAKIPKNKKILVAVSGGKDSATVAYVLHKSGYNIEGFHIDLKIGNYSDRCRNAAEELCKKLGIKLHVYDTKKKLGAGMCYIRTAVQNSNGKKRLKNCAICGVIKKWIFNREARKIKADYIATGHNLDDEAQTFLVNIFKGSPNLNANTGIITKNTPNEKLIPRLKPLFYIPENEIKNYAKRMKLPVVYEKCPCALDSYRIQVRNFLNELTNKDKEKIIENLERLSPLIQKRKDSKLNFCEICGEPSRNRICKKCELVNI